MDGGWVNGKHFGHIGKHGTPQPGLLEQTLAFCQLYEGLGMQLSRNRQ